MSVNLLELLQGQMGGAAIDAAAKMLGSNRANAEKGLNSSLIGVLGGLMNGAGAPGGAEKIFDLVTKGGIDDSLLNNIGGIFSGGNTDAITKTGNGLLGSLFGGSKLGTLANIVGKVSGLGGGASSGLLSMVAPMAIGLLKRYAMSKGMNALGLGSLLGGQKSFLSKAAGPDMSDFLGLASGMMGGAKETGAKAVGKTTGAVKNVGSSARGAATQATSSGGGLLKKILPIALLAILGVLGWQMCSGDVANMADKTADMGKNVAAGAMDKTKEAADAAAMKAKQAADAAAMKAKEAMSKGADFFKFEKGSMSANFADFLTNKNANLSRTFVLDKVEFDTGKASLRSVSQAQLKNVAKILNEYKGVNIELQGHTDSTGNAASNTKLSQARAAAVKAFLATQGIAANRLGAKGFGSTKPRGDNGTAAGRQQNRRTEIKVTKR